MLLHIRLCDPPTRLIFTSRLFILLLLERFGGQACSRDVNKGSILSVTLSLWWSVSSVACSMCLLLSQGRRREKTEGLNVEVRLDPPPAGYLATVGYGARIELTAPNTNPMAIVSSQLMMQRYGRSRHTNVYTHEHSLVSVGYWMAVVLTRTLSLPTHQHIPFGFL